MNEVDIVLNKILKKFGKINILINNAAMQRVGLFEQSQFIDVLQTNLIGTMYLTQKILPMLNAGDTIFNVLSVHAFMTRRKKISYDVSKAGLLMFTKELAFELAERKITCNAISIGAYQT